MAERPEDLSLPASVVARIIKDAVIVNFVGQMCAVLHTDLMMVEFGFKVYSTTLAP